MQKKRNLLFLLTLLFPLTILAYDAQIDGIYYNFTAFDKTATVTYLGKYSFQNNTAYSGDVVIPKTVVLQWCHLYRDRPLARMHL
jgi:hypothetical protein